MKKWFIPLALLLLLTACGEDESISPSEESQTEVKAPEGELDPTAPIEVDDAESASFKALADGKIEEGTAVILAGTVTELTDDAAFPGFVLSGDDREVLIRNMAETPVEVGDAVRVNGIYDGNAEEDMPLISVSVITVE